MGGLRRIEADKRIYDSRYTIYESLENSGWARSMAADHWMDGSLDGWIDGLTDGGSVGQGALGVAFIFFAGLAWIRLDF